MTHALIYAAGLCLLALAGEAYAAGGDIRQRMSMLQRPRYSPPFWVWIAIGVFYYVICFTALYRLFLAQAAAPFRVAAIWLLATMMVINVVWNWFFFRSRNFGHAYLLTLPYTAIAVLLLCLLSDVDRTAAIWFGPYLVYLIFANVWGYSVWKLNRWPG